MRVLEGFCRLVMGLDVEDRVSLKSIAFVYYCVKESNLIEGWTWLACSMNKLSCLLLFHREKTSSM